MPEFENWVPLQRLTVAHLPGYGNISGVYAIRSRRNAELLYIGSSKNLRRRIFGNYLEVELAWIATEAYRTKEAELKGPGGGGAGWWRPARSA